MTEVVRVVLAILGVSGIAWGIVTLRTLAPRASRSQLSADQVRGVFAIGLLQIVGGVAWLITAIARVEWAAWLAIATLLAAPVVRLIVRRRTGHLT
jgi:hypothetical protein